MSFIACSDCVAVDIRNARRSGPRGWPVPALLGDESALKFVCHNGGRRRKLTGRILFGTLIAAMLIVLRFE